MRVNEHKFCGLLGYTRSVRVLDLVGSIITIRGSGGNYGTQQYLPPGLQRPRCNKQYD